MPTLLDRLKERKIVQWAVAYLAGSYAGLQVIDLMAEPFGITALFRRAVIVFLVFGFCGALVLAWFHAEKGRQRVTAVETALLAILFLVGISSSVATYRLGDPETPALDVRTASGLTGPVVAVLPFEDVSHSEEEASHVVDAIHSRVVTNLSQLAGINAISRSSVMMVDRANRTIDQVAQDLGASAILEGQIQKAGDAVLITVSLTEPTTGVSLWAAVYDQIIEPERMFAVQGEIAGAIAEALAVALAPNDRATLARIPTHDRIASDFYMRGREAEDRADRGEREFFRVALDFYEQAVGQDPLYADAHAARARMIWSVYWRITSPRTREAVESLRAAAQRAIELNPELAAGHLMLGEYLRWHAQDHTGALESYRLANRLDPDNVRALTSLAYMNMQAGDFAAAQARMDRATELDPRDGGSQRLAGSLAFYTRRYDDAEVHHMRAARRFAPDFETATPDPDHFMETRLVFGLQIGTFLAADGDTRRAYQALGDVIEKTRMNSVDLSGFLSDFGDPRGIPDAAPFNIGRTMLQLDEVVRRLHPDSIGPDVRATLLRLAGEDREEQRRLWSLVGDAYADDQYGGAGEQDYNNAHEEVQERSRVALAFARAGRREDALAQMNRARELTDTHLLVELALNAEPRWAMTLMELGDHDEALDLLEDMLSRPSAISVNLLKVQPEWDPIREHPRFQALLNLR